MNREVAHLKHIIKAIDRIITKIGDKKTFIDDEDRIDIVVLSLQTMAESTQKLSEESKQLYPYIEWKKIAGLRNILVHNYLEGYDLELISGLVDQKLPELRQVATELLDQLRTNNDQSI